MLYRLLLRPLIFGLSRRDPEHAHLRAIRLMAALGRFPPLLRVVRPFQMGAGHLDESSEREVFGVRFPTPVGLAAGFDKDGVVLPTLAALGFGFVEVGTVTWHAQPGNPRPRIFRLPTAGALINRMGFNNCGAQAMAEHLARTPPLPIPIGISLGKSRSTPVEEAADDYCASLRVLAPYGDFFTINISSPNTPGLRSLQEVDRLETLLSALQRTMSLLPSPRPLLVKIAPDLSEQAVCDVLEVCTQQHISGMIAINTVRVGPDTAHPECESGGLSGKPLTETARRMVRFIHRQTDGRLPIVGVGGIATPDDALRMFEAGASLVQVYTGFIYEGPGLIRAINRAIT
jgi:dihydroorotate dehydrogenase